MSHNQSSPSLKPLFAVVAVLVSMVSPAMAAHLHQHDPDALAADPRSAERRLAPELAGLGDNHFAVSTENAEAQAFFDQGLLLTYGFNHQEALRAFKEAARLDPELAMAYWGWALVLGPNLNLAMSSEASAQAYEAILLALDHAAAASDRERALIEALARRYSADPSAERVTLDAAYATAMAEVYEVYSQDADIATLFAAALMNTSPWNYWTPEGRPRRDTERTAGVLVRAIERDPHHEGALHYYIHLIESVAPWRGERAADLLRGLAPSAGHLEHMPSHIYMQVGRYDEAYEVNVRASEADEDYLAQCLRQGIYPLTYYPHNTHFLVWAAAMEGRQETALAAARKVASQVPEDRHGDAWALFEVFSSMPLSVMMRFGAWQEILSEPQPRVEERFLTGMWHYARGMALLRTSGVRKAKKELEQLARIEHDRRSAEAMIGFSTASSLLTIAKELLAAEIDAERGRYPQAIGRAERALRLEDALHYNEPPEWFVPVRHTLGGILVEAGLPREAETVFYQDLRQNPENGYALYGLWQALTAQDRHSEALSVRERFDEAWKAADVPLTRSRY